MGPDALDAAMGRADAVVLAASGTPANRDLFDARRFELMRSDALFVNVSRGMLVDEEALSLALRNGELAAAALDVTREEPIPVHSPLWDVPNLRLSPHSSAAQEGYWEGLVELFCDNLRRFLDGQPMRNLIAPATLSIADEPT
jgi:phosphoglycerate dehydrogenase-like enzyme